MSRPTRPASPRWSRRRAGCCSPGHTTDDTVRRIEGLARAYGLQVTAVTAWSSLTLVRAPGTALVTLPVTPLGVNMRVVTAVLATVAAAGGPDGPPEPGVLRERLRTASTLRPYPTLVFAIAAPTGATALAVIFGAVRPSSFVLIPLAAALGAVARRALGRRGVDLVGQAFAAALIAGLAGAVSIVLDVTSRPASSRSARRWCSCPARTCSTGCSTSPPNA
ncbi:threonine/serine exporter family protein [Piscicoccus intestinalis]|uniref:threonine/serine exporter family protein n=1 Tax=Piscicoccus intestinalis TaxID=746033 RepID=UPI000A04DBDC|nr:threonine/serine exporter family protein [Piscicoccus intestinalis]